MVGAQVPENCLLREVQEHFRIQHGQHQVRLILRLKECIVSVVHGSERPSPHKSLLDAVYGYILPVGYFGGRKRIFDRVELHRREILQAARSDHVLDDGGL